MIFPENDQALVKFYDDISMLVNYSDGKYSLTEVYNMIPWEFMIYLIQYKKYIEDLKNKK